MGLRGFSLVVVTCLGCAGHAPPAAAPAQPIAKVEAVAQAEAPPDLSPVATPNDLVLVGRLARPRALVETVAAWSGLPVHITDVLPSEVSALADVVAWDAPVEIAVVLARHSSEKVAPPEAVISIGIASLPRAVDFARSRGLNTVRVSNTAYRVNVSDDVTCALSASAGSVPARLLCGPAWQDIEDLLPYATRGLPREALGKGDLHIELRGAPLQQRYSQEIAAVRLLTGLLLRQVGTDSPRLDRALTDAAYGVADELKLFAMEADKFEITGTLDDAAKALEFGYSLSFVKDNSVIAQLAEDAGKRSGPPPDMFWDLPKNGTSGGYFVGLDTKRITQFANVGAELLDAYLEQQKASAGFRHRARSLFDSLPLGFSAGAHVMGNIPLTKDASPTTLFNHRLGWRVGVTEARVEKAAKLFTDIESLLADHELPKLLKERASVEAKLIPKLKHRATHVKGVSGNAFAFTLEVPPALLEQFAKLEATPLKKADAHKPVTTTLVLAGDGERTWLSLAADEKSAVTQLEAARSGHEGRLRDDPALAGLKSRPTTGGGFFTLEAALAAFQSALRDRADDVAGALAQAPNHGRAPWLTRLEETPTAGGGVRMSASIRLPQQAFEDIAALAPFFLQHALHD